MDAASRVLQGWKEGSLPDGMVFDAEYLGSVLPGYGSEMVRIEELTTGFVHLEVVVGFAVPFPCLGTLILPPGFQRWNNHFSPEPLNPQILRTATFHPPAEPSRCCNSWVVFFWSASVFFMFFPFTGHHALGILFCVWDITAGWPLDHQILQDPLCAPSMRASKAAKEKSHPWRPELGGDSASHWPRVGFSEPCYAGKWTNRRWTVFMDRSGLFWAKGEISINSTTLMNIHFWCVLMCVDMCWYICCIHTIRTSSEFLPGKEKVDPKSDPALSCAVTTVTIMVSCGKGWASPCPNRSRIPPDLGLSENVGLIFPMK